MRGNRRGPVADFTLVTNPLGASNRARHAMRKAIRASAARPNQPVEFLAGHLCNRLGIVHGQLILGHGSSHLLSIFLQTRRPSRLVIPSPFPAIYLDLLQRRGVEILRVPLRKEEGFTLDVERFKRLWNESGAAFLLNPHDPTGTFLDETRILDLVDTSNRLGKPLIIDETLVEFINPASPVQEAASVGHVLILRSFSFYYGLAGLRVGYAVGNAALIQEMRAIIEPWPVNNVAAAAALASLRDKGFPRRTARFLAAEQAYLAKKLAQISDIECFSLPWGYLIRFEPVVANLADRLLEKGIIADVFVDSEENQYVRLPFRSHRLNGLFARRLGWVLKDQRNSTSQSE